MAIVINATTTTTTIAKVRERTLNLLGNTVIGQGSKSHDDTRIKSAYNEVYADLKEESLAVWSKTGLVPDEVVPHLVALMAFNAVDDFGVSNERYARIVNRSSVAKREIRSLVTPDYESLGNPTDF